MLKINREDWDASISEELKEMLRHSLKRLSSTIYYCQHLFNTTPPEFYSITLSSVQIDRKNGETDFYQFNFFRSDFEPPYEELQADVECVSVDGVHSAGTIFFSFINEAS